MRVLYNTTAPLVACPSKQATVKLLNSFVSLTATMRQFFLCTLLCALPIAVPAQTRRSVRQPRQANSVLSNSSVSDWANRVMSNDAKTRASAEAALVHEAGRSLPLLRRFLNTDNEDLHQETFEIIRRIGPPV